jgi:hypothetical protein
MSSKFDKALPGFNTNLKHGGKIYHVQTEDSGKSHPHIITHVFVDGNIIASRKESYQQQLGRSDVNDVVREMMRKQHREMADKVAAGGFDSQLGFSVEVEVEPEAEASSTPPAASEEPSAPPGEARARAKRTSGIYRKIYRREPTPIPVVPSKADRERMSKIEKKGLADKRLKRVYMGGQDVGGKDAQEGKEGTSQDKSLEEIIADYLSGKVSKE